MHCGTALQWCMVIPHTVQHSTAQNSTPQHSIKPLDTTTCTLHMAQMLVADSGETLIGYTGMVIVTYYPRLSEPFVCCSFPHVCILAQTRQKEEKTLKYFFLWHTMVSTSHSSLPSISINCGYSYPSPPAT